MASHEQVILEMVLRGKNESRSAFQQAARDIDDLGDETDHTARRFQHMERVARGALLGIAATAKVAGRAVVLGFRAALVAGGVGVAGVAAGGILTKMLVGTASDAQEVKSKFDAVFKDLSGSVRAWVAENASALGRSTVDLERWASSLQDTFVPLGFARDAAANLSKQLTILGVDLASFNNQDTEETIQLLTSALVGNHEAVRRFGIMITEATLQEEMARRSAAGLTLASEEQEKVMARLGLIFRMTTDAQGDAIRTSGEHANVARRLQAAWHDAGEAIGSRLLPVMVKIKLELAAWLNQMRESGGLATLGDALAAGFEKAWEWIKLGVNYTITNMPRLVAGLGEFVKKAYEFFSNIPEWLAIAGLKVELFWLNAQKGALILKDTVVGVVNDIALQIQTKLDGLFSWGGSGGGGAGGSGIAKGGGPGLLLKLLDLLMGTTRADAQYYTAGSQGRNPFRGQREIDDELSRQYGYRSQGRNPFRGTEPDTGRRGGVRSQGRNPFRNPDIDPSRPPTGQEIALERWWDEQFQSKVEEALGRMQSRPPRAMGGKVGDAFGRMQSRPSLGAAADETALGIIEGRIREVNEQIEAKATTAFGRSGKFDEAIDKAVSWFAEFWYNMFSGKGGSPETPVASATQNFVYRMRPEHKAYLAAQAKYPGVPSHLWDEASTYVAQSRAASQNPLHGATLTIKGIDRGIVELGTASAF